MFERVFERLVDRVTFATLEQRAPWRGRAISRGFQSLVRWSAPSTVSDAALAEFMSGTCTAPYGGGACTNCNDTTGCSAGLNISGYCTDPSNNHWCSFDSPSWECHDCYDWVNSTYCVCQTYNPVAC